MKTIVESILKSIDKGIYFDRHFVIDKIIRDYSDDYLSFAAKKQAKGKVTEYLHSEIAKVISSFDKTLITREPFDAAII